ncbi:MAG: hypothetical protein E7488_02230 [Ruminococcaceae bacterium]|nr:hypothetical protein [Oscillospiraceae bacterium]
MLKQAEKIRLTIPYNFKSRDMAFFGLAALVCFFFMSHPDIWETANHSYVFLECLFSGRFFDYYEVVAAHDSWYYYINGANYNILIYIIFGIWELPVFIINQIFSLPLDESFMIHWAKAVPCFFYIGCGWMLKNLGEKLGLAKEKAFMAAMFFLFNPIAFFSPVVMGQYDTLCLFFTLWALIYYAQGRYQKFSFILGIGVVCKFFPLMIFVPLILLVEKRIPKLLQYGITTLWLYIPTTLLFMGRTGDAGGFTMAMINRMFELTVPMGITDMPLFILLYAIVVFAAFLYNPKSEQTVKYLTVYVPMVVFGLLFICIHWHPQWLVLLMPFVVMTTHLHTNRTPWYWLDIVMAAGYFLIGFCYNAGQTGAVLFDGGWMWMLFDMRIATQKHWMHLDNFLKNVPFVFQLAPVLFTGSVLANIILKLPVDNSTLADRLSDGGHYDRISDKVYLYGIFVIGFICIWTVPSVLEFLNAFEIISLADVL